MAVVETRRQRRQPEPDWTIHVGEFVGRSVVNGVSAGVFNVWRQDQPEVRHRMTILNPDYLFYPEEPQPGARLLFTVEVTE
jgi:hypothetical protein